MRNRFIYPLIGALAAAEASAQATATLTGRITDRSTGSAIPGARVFLSPDSRTAVTDSAGRFELRGIAATISRLTITAQPFPTLNVTLDLTGVTFLDRAIVLDSTRAVQTLSAVGVSAPALVPNYRLAAFERRRSLGHGQYLTEENILASGAYTVADAIRPMRGIVYECGGGGGAGCTVRMARAPDRCRPEWIVDDQTLNDFGPVTPIRDIVGIEVYLGPTELPAEYTGRFGGCGVIVIWTRSGPTRRRP